MKIWIRKDIKKNSIMLAFEDANKTYYGDLEPVLYIPIDIEEWTEIDLGEFIKEDRETGISRKCVDCLHDTGEYGPFCQDLGIDCNFQDKWEPKEASEGDVMFTCGNCGKTFKTYHDGEGYNTGFCPTCKNLQDTVGLDEKEVEKK